MSALENRRRRPHNGAEAVAAAPRAPSVRNPRDTAHDPPVQPPTVAFLSTSTLEQRVCGRSGFVYAVFDPRASEQGIALPGKFLWHSSAIGDILRSSPGGTWGVAAQEDGRAKVSSLTCGYPRYGRGR